MFNKEYLSINFSESIRFQYYKLPQRPPVSTAVCRHDSCITLLHLCCAARPQLPNPADADRTYELNSAYSAVDILFVHLNFYEHHEDSKH